jgi:hypothetical protein
LRAKLPQIAATVPRNFSTLRQFELPRSVGGVATPPQLPALAQDPPLKYLIPRPSIGEAKRCSIAMTAFEKIPKNRNIGGA